MSETVKSTETTERLKAIAHNLRSAHPDNYHGRCREAATDTYQCLVTEGFDARVVCGALKGIAPTNWTHDTPPCRGRHYWAEALLDGVVYIVEPNSSSTGDAGEPAVYDSQPIDYLKYPDSVEEGMKWATKNTDPYGGVP